MQPLVEVSNLTKRYRGIKVNGVVKPALDQLSLNLDAGKIIGLLGENGSGKTTLLKILAGVLEPTSGQVSIDGQEIGAKTKALTSFLPDAAWLPESISVDAAIGRHTDYFADFDARKATDLVEFLGLERSLKTNHMSKGMREKLQLALVMSRSARLYLLDEPISGVDPAARQTLLDTILRGWNPESTLFISTHLVTDIEPVLDEAVFLHAGKLFKQGEADELREAYGMSLDLIFRKEYSRVR